MPTAIWISYNDWLIDWYRYSGRLVKVWNHAVFTLCLRKKRHSFYICHNLVKCHPMLLIFGRDIHGEMRNKPHIDGPLHLLLYVRPVPCRNWQQFLCSVFPIDRPYDTSCHSEPSHCVWLPALLQATVTENLLKSSSDKFTWRLICQNHTL